MARRRLPHLMRVLAGLCARLPGAAPARELLHFYFGFTGRISLKAYWRYWLLPLLLILSASQVFYSLGHSLQVADVTMLPLLWPVLAVSAKRLHDINLSTKWLLLHCLPVIGTALLLFANACIPGSKRKNRHAAAKKKARKKTRQRTGSR